MLSDSISDRTIVLLLLFVPSRKFFGLPYSYKTNAPLYNRLEPTKLMCRLICNLPELNIRILIRLLPIFINRYELRI